MHILPDLGKDHRHARILADGYIQLRGGIYICLKIRKHGARSILLLRFFTAGNAVHKILRQDLIGLNHKRFNGFCNTV